MNTYVKISKKIGFEHRNVTYPTLDEVKQLLTRVSEGDEDAFEKIFRYHRFLPSPKNTGEEQIMNIVTSTFKIGSTIFQK